MYLHIELCIQVILVDVYRLIKKKIKMLPSLKGINESYA
jgi:hypothetical protein